MTLKVPRPHAHEYPDFHKPYVQALDHEIDGLAALERQQSAIEHMAHLTPEQASYRYAEGKWTVKEVIGHLSDSERVFGYRLLRIARGDETPLPGFDEQLFAANSNADRREIPDLAHELAAVRASTLALVRSLDDRMLTIRGIVREHPISVRGQIFVIAGHLAHHLRILRERYAVEL